MYTKILLIKGGPMLLAAVLTVESMTWIYNTVISYIASTIH